MSVSFGAYWQLLSAYLRPQPARVVLMAALLLLSIGLQLFNPQIVRFFLDTTRSGDSSLLWVAALAFLVLAFGQRAIALAALYVGEQVGWRATNALRHDLTAHCLRLDLGFHKRHTPGELIERINGDVDALGNFLSQFTIRVFGNVLLILGILVLLFREDWRVGLGLSLYAALTFVVLLAIQQIAVGRWAATRQAGAELTGFLEERLSGLEDLRSSGATSYAIRRFVGLNYRVYRAELSAYLAANLNFVITNALFIIGYTIGLAVGASLYTQGMVSIGAAFLIVYYIGMLADPLETIRAQAEDLQRAGGSVVRIRELLAFRPKVQEQVHATLPAGALAVQFDQVAFAYDDETSTPVSDDAATDEMPEDDTGFALQGVQFTLQPGQVLGLLGRTGSGKTTLSRLLFRLYDPTSGAIRLAQTDLRDLALTDLRTRVGMVTQDVQIFAASVRENLSLFNPHINDAQIEAALNELGLLAWVQALPQGLDTPLGAGGQGLSAGEAQLLAFVRVLLRDPGLVILDEASSRLDPATARLLEQAVTRLLAGRTGIIIAHRLATVQRADTILILENGQIAEYGDRTTLAADPNSRFARLLVTGMEEVLA